MHANIKLLEKQSIDAALNKEWEKAVNLNKLILDKNPKDKNAKVRLGRAYLKTEKFTEAKKIFKEILETDPINSIARKNYKLASEKNSDNKATTSKTSKENSTKVLIKEPGTTTQVEIKAPKNILDKLEPGQELNCKSYKTKLSFFLGKEEIGSVSNELTSVVYNAKKRDCDVKVSVVKANEDHFTLILKCKEPVFKSEKQRENPYLSKDIIEDDDEEESQSE